MKFIVVVLIGIAFLTITATANNFYLPSYLEDKKEIVFNDFVIHQYNSTCIKTINYEFIFVDNLNQTFDKHQQIIVSQLERYSNKIIVANVFLR
jgi:hypothetical protein